MDKDGKVDDLMTGIPLMQGGDSMDKNQQQIEKSSEKLFQSIQHLLLLIWLLNIAMKDYESHGQ